MVHVCVIVYNGHRRVTFVDTPPAEGLGNITEKGGADLVKEGWEHGLYYKIEVCFISILYDSKWVVKQGKGKLKYLGIVYTWLGN